MTVGSTKVALVLDPGYGERLSALSAEMSVWIIESPANIAAAKGIWGQQPRPEHTVTTFKSDSFEGLMDNVELHHGHYQAPPFQDLEVIGLPLDAEIQGVLYEYGFAPATSTRRGFLASRTGNSGTSHGESL